MLATGFASRLRERQQDLAALHCLLADESSRAVGGRFEWVDGCLTRAIEQGGWVLLDNANLCNPTVLDRLNPLLEPGGSLFLAEAGSVGGVSRVVAPHPEFRLLLALDPRHGEAYLGTLLLPPREQAAAAAAFEDQGSSSAWTLSQRLRLRLPAALPALLL
ncbi:uncharacterized protein HaLaN_16382 [Haematococcus lacustris]|uniref:ATPase dynein-related AAA domain-containing protein n=1 Tax=Haematococcus lacustris TaxID=44745 RepID=A0A699ZKC2_HAELA|nr:uncharacterized protein HaLaN_16382 [Haematococcus lacustris]